MAESAEAARPLADWDDRSNADADSISVATACAISGAAASPNMGYHSNAAAAFC